MATIPANTFISSHHSSDADSGEGEAIHPQSPSPGDQPWSLSVSPSPFFLILMPRKYTELKLVVCFYICIKMTSLLNTGPEFPGLMKLVQIVCVKASEMLTALENFSLGNIPDC